MILELTERQERLRAAAASFASRDVTPLAATIDERNALPSELTGGAALRELTALARAEESDEGGDRVTAAVVVEALARGSAAVALSVGLSQLVGSALNRDGSEPQRQRWVNALSAGDVAGTIAVAEPGTRLDEHPGGLMVHDFRAAWVASLQVAEIGVFVAVPPNPGQPGVAWLRSTSSGDLTRVERPDPLGLRGAGWADAICERIRVEPESLLGTDRSAWDASARWVLAQARVLCAAVAVGIGRSALEQAVAATRALADRGSQAVRFDLADAATELDAAWMLTLKAASDTGRADAHLPAMAKFLATEAAVRAADTALRLTAPLSYRRGSIPERLWRDAHTIDAVFGTSHRARQDAAYGLGLVDG